MTLDVAFCLLDYKLLSLSFPTFKFPVFHFLLIINPNRQGRQEERLGCHSAIGKESKEENEEKREIRTGHSHSRIMSFSSHSRLGIAALTILSPENGLALKDDNQTFISVTYGKHS